MTQPDITGQLAASIGADLNRAGIDIDDDEAQLLAERALADLTMKRLVDSAVHMPAGLKDAGSAALFARDRHYTSTACLHMRHESCRRRCKFCDHECRCPCHDGKPGPAPRTERYTLIAGGDPHQNYNIDEALALARYYLYSGRDVHLEPYEPGGEQTPSPWSPLAIDPLPIDPPGI